MNPDAELLTQYAASRSETAFSELVKRHVDLVYSAALRLTNGDAHHAQDVTQQVFIELSRQAGALVKHPALAGWLYTTTRNVARRIARSNHRRQVREQEATHMNELLREDSTETNWVLLRPLLDDAMHELGETDRNALVLRFFQNKNLADVGNALDLGENAARMRVNRALEKLEAILKRRGVTLGAGGLVAIVSANAVQAAPVGLVTVITSAVSLTGAALATSTTAVATKAIAMTTLQKTLVTAAIAAAVGTGIYETHQASISRSDAAILRQQQAPLAEQVQQLRTARDQDAAALAALRNENDRLRSDSSELIRLRAEVTALRRGNPPSQTATTRTSIPTVPALESGNAPDDIGRKFGLAVINGEPSAFSNIVELSKSEHKSLATNSPGLNDTQRGDLSRQTFAPLHTAFLLITDAAAQGNQFAIDAIGRATRVPELNGLAIQALGKLAGGGNADALEIVVNPDKYGVLLSSAVSAMKPAADNGNQRAIDALVAVTRNPDQRALWYMAGDGLGKAAEAGNSAAIDGLINLLASTNISIRKTAISGLTGAAANQNAKAIEALRAAGL